MTVFTSHRLALHCFSRRLSAPKEKSSTLPIERRRFRREASAASGSEEADIVIRQPPPPTPGAPPAPSSNQAKGRRENSRELASAISAVSVGSSQRALLPTPRTDAARRRWSLREDMVWGRSLEKTSEV